MGSATQGDLHRCLTGMKTKLAPQITILPVKWEKENPVELLALAQGHARYNNPRTINLLRALQAHQPILPPGSRRVAGRA